MKEIILPIQRSVYKKELNKTYLAIEVPGRYVEDYQMQMLHYNHMEGLLEMRGRGVYDTGIYEYDVSGRQTMESVFKSKKMDKKDIKEFLLQFCDILLLLSNHMLNETCLLLSPEHIFYENGRYFFCYFPPGAEEIKEAFHKLTEFFVRQTDYQDTEGVQMAFTLHKETMEENYSLIKIMEKIEDIPASTYHEEEDINCLEEEDTEEEMLKEANSFWLPVKEFLKKHKKPKWGDWHELYMEEEKL